MRLWITEKPDIGRKLAKALGGGNEVGGTHIYLANGDTIAFCRGHILELQQPHDYDEAYKAWSWDTIPFPIPTKLELKPNADTYKYYKAIKDLLAKTSNVVHCGDPDREGETIVWQVLRHLKYTGPVQRLWLQDTTPAGLQRAISRLQPKEETFGLFMAGAARSRADWYYGLNLTRAATLRFQRNRDDGTYNTGRVQTAVLALCVRRHLEITNFRPTGYFDFAAKVSTQDGHTLVMRSVPTADARVTDEVIANRLAGGAKGQTGRIDVKREDKRQAPPALFDLPALQSAANGALGWTYQRTLDVVQALYDKQLLSYPRTDCQFLPEGHVNEIAAVAGHLLRHDDLSLAKSIWTKQEPITRKTVYNDGKVGAHYAIRPTTESANLSALSEDESKLYLLVARQYLQVHLPDYEFEATSISAVFGNLQFIATGTAPQVMGWREMRGSVGKDNGPEESDEDSEDRVLPRVRDGENGRAEDVRAVGKQTKPPAGFYTEKAIGSLMENVANHVPDAHAKAVFRREKIGLGTPATRASIIEGLKKNGYLGLTKKMLIPTSKAIAYIGAMSIAAPETCDPVSTATWEESLSDIADGTGNPVHFMDGIWAKTAEFVAAIKAAEVSGFEAVTAKPRKYDGPKCNSRSKGAFPLAVPKGGKDAAKAVGAWWDPDSFVWFIPPGKDTAAAIAAGFMTANAQPADGSQAKIKKADFEAARNAERPKSWTAGSYVLTVPKGQSDAAKATGAWWDGEQFTWFLAPGKDTAAAIAAGYMSVGDRPSDGTPLPPKEGFSGSGGKGGAWKGKSGKGSSKGKTGAWKKGGRS